MAHISLGQNETQNTADAQEETEPLGKLLARYWVLLRKYYWLLVIVSALGVVAAYVHTQRQPRIYETSTKIIFRDTMPNVFGRQIERVEFFNPGEMWQFEQFWNTQREVMNSTWFAEQVVKRNGLLDHPGMLDDEAPADKAAATREAAHRVQAMSTVNLQPNSRVAVITVRTTDPATAEVVANAVADSYVQYTRDVQSGGLTKIIDWFDSYVGQKRTELTDAQAALHQFKRDNNILSISYEERQNLTAANMEAVNRQLNQVLGELDGEEAMLRQLNTMERTGEDLKALARMVDSNALSVAIEREQALDQELAKVTTRYGAEHDNVKEVSRQLEVVRGNIDTEIARIRAGVKHRVALLKDEAAKKEKRLEDLKEEAFELNELGLKYAQIKDKADTLRQLYDAVLKRSEELDINSMYESKTIEILQPAERPLAPVSPSLPLNLLLGLGIGIALGGTLIVLIDSLDNTVKSESEIERYTRKPILGHLPQIDQNLLKEFGSVDTMTAIAPKGSFAEGIKTLRTNLMFMSPDNPPALMLVTSPGPGEGKTLISINMAIAMAQSGQRTLVLDSDLRRPRVHKALGLENEVGLSSIIAGELTIEQAVQQTGIDNLHAISCGPIPENPQELLHTETFHQIVADLRQKYDRVIFDSPPLAAVADGLVLSHSVDAVLLILKFGKTRRELLKRSVEQLEAIGAPFMGCILNDISASSGSAYAYSYQYYRYRYDEPDEDKKGRNKTRLAS